MARDLRNKIAVITGGAQGIGFAIADNFLKNGATVLILDINEELGNEVVKALNVKYDNRTEFYKCDVTTDLDAVSEDILNKYKTVDVLVNNAGIADEKSVRRIMGINAIAVMEWTMKFWEHMRVDHNGKGGTIMNVASVYGYCIDPFAPFYKASKHAVMGFTRTLGHDDNYKKCGVRVVALCPGFTETNLMQDFDGSDTMMYKEYLEFVKNGVVWQSPGSVGKAAVEVFERADSGTAWLIAGAQHIKEVPY